MNKTENKPQRQRKKRSKKYILHQKVNPKILGVELYNQKITTPYKVYLSCKLSLEKDIHSFNELEKKVQSIQVTWNTQYECPLITKINIFTTQTYGIITFTIGFFEQSQVIYLRKLKFFVIEQIEQGDHEQFKSKEDLHELLQKYNQLSRKMDGLESRLKRNESMVVESETQLKTELTKISLALKEKKEHVEKEAKNEPRTSVTERKQKLVEIEKFTKNTFEAKRANASHQYHLDRNKPRLLIVKNWKMFRQVLKRTLQKKASRKNVMHDYVSRLELEIESYFSEKEKLNKKKIITKKEFFTLKAKVEFIDYLWMLLELDGKKELMIANNLSCKQLINELEPFLGVLEATVSKAVIFNYWIYCPQELLLKLRGYAVLKDFLSNLLKLNSHTVMVNEG